MPQGMPRHPSRIKRRSIMNFQVTRKDTGDTETVETVNLMAACARMSEDGKHPLDIRPMNSDTIPAPPPAHQNSTWAEQVTDDAAKTRIEAQHASLAKNGVHVNTSEQLYATGTRMADVGYATQASRKVEHDRKQPIADVAHELRVIVQGEKRRDIEIKAGDLGKGIAVNGKITFDGLALTEQALRGLLARLESPALGYVLGLRERCVELLADKQRTGLEDPRIQDDKRKIAAVLQHECRHNPDVPLKIRTRQGVGDVFAVLSPSYTPADAPDVLSELLETLPANARGTFAYDALSTAWELRASVWTPTPVEEQAVGEAFEGYASFSSRDNGTSRFRGGGGISLIRCLNASTYSAGTELSRVHRSGIRANIDDLVARTTSSIRVLCEAWGMGRQAVVETPSGVSINDAIPGFWRYCLMDRRSELQGVLPGRSEKHVESLTRALWAEKRDPNGLVRTDFAQGWTRYIQEQPAPVRRDAEVAIGGWLVNARKLECDLRAWLTGRGLPTEADRGA
jgi:hypothetical protein